MEKITSHRHIAAIPHPCRGHINPLMNLSRFLATKDNLLITFVVTEEWLGLITSDSAGPLPSNIRLQTIPNVIPSERTRGADLNSFYRAVYTKMSDHVEQLIDRLEPPVGFVIADSISAWAADICKRRNIPVSSFWTQSASLFSTMYLFGELDTTGRLPADLGKEDEALAYMPKVSRLIASTGSNSSELDILRQFISSFSWFATAQSLLLTSFYELESHTIDTLKSHLSLPIYSLGPSIPYLTLDSNHHTDADTTSSSLKWLDSQTKCSVLYISFGSFHSTSDAQVDELVKGLNATGVRYLWVARGEHEKVKELNGEVGMVVPWCDQLRVLCHPSIGGFLTHCGWNSTSEGVYAGVPMLTFPLSFDQFPNSKLIVDIWKIGLRLKDEESDEKVIGREEIAEMVRRLMDFDAEESKGIRRRAAELMQMCRGAVTEAGSSSANLDAFVEDISSKKWRVRA